MHFKLPCRIYYLEYNGAKLILKFIVLPVNGDLFLNYELYQLPVSDNYDNIRNGLYNNPEAIDIIDRISKTLITSQILGLNEIINFDIYLTNLSQNIVRQDLAVVINFIFQDKQLRLALMPLQLVGLSNFVKSFALNYDTWKIKLFELYKEEKEKIIVKEEIPIIEPEIIKEELPLFNSDNIINEVLQLAPSNLTIYYLSLYLYNAKYIIEIEKTEKTCIIKLPPIFDFNMTLQNELNIVYQIKQIPFSKEEIVSRSKSLFKILNNIVLNDLHNENIHNIYIIVYLLFLYSAKLTNEVLALNANYNIQKTFVNVINTTLNKIQRLYEVDIVLQFQFDNKLIDKYVETFDKQYLDLKIKKYQYLINIDKKVFVDSVLEEIKQDPPREIAGLKLNNLTFISSPKLLDIDMVLQNNLRNPPIETSLLNYKLIRDRIICDNYNTYINITDNSPLNILKTDKLNPYIKLHLQTIQSKIIPQLNNNQDQLNHNLSTLLILNSYITPNLINNNKDINTNLFLLYQIIIPYLYDRFQITKFMDYFH